MSTAPLSSRVYNIKNAKVYTPIKGQEYLVFSYYFLPPEHINEKIYGMGVFLGGFPSLEEAEKAIVKVADENPKLNPHFRICSSGQWFVFTPHIKPEEVDYIDKKGNEIYTNQIMRDYEEKIKQLKSNDDYVKLSQQIDKDSDDSDSILHYSKLQLQKSYQEHFIKQKQQELDLASKNLSKLNSSISKIDSSHSDFSSRWEKECKHILQ